MDNMEYIDDYFKGAPGDEQKQEFEDRIINDISFAEEVAFYISANGMVHQQLQEEKKQRFREIYEERKVIPITRRPVNKILRYMAAASAVAAILLLTWFFSADNTSPQQLADRYIQQNFQQLHVTMGNQDSLQAGLSLYNQGKVTEALRQFETILKNDSTSDDAKKYAGIASLRLEQYDKALAYFTLLASDTARFSNFGKFYEAVTLLKRDRNGDKDAAKSLLKEVRDSEKMEGGTEAAQWLKKLD